MDKKDTHDQKATDRGWLDMKMRLDQELPVVENRRRPIGGWLWFSLIFVGLLAGAGWLYFSGKGTEKQPARPAEFSQPVAVSADRPVDVSTTQVIGNQPIVLKKEAENGISKIEKAVASGSKIQFENHLRNSQADGSNLTNSASPEIQPTLKSPVLHNPFSEKTGANFSPKMDAANEPIASIQPVLTEPNGQPFLIEKPIARADFSLNPLAEKQISAARFSAENRLADFSKTTIPFKNKGARRFHFGAFTGLQTIDFQRFNGFSIGLVGEKISRSGRRRLSVGLAWNRVIHAQHPNLETDNSAEFEHGFYLNETKDSALIFATPVLDAAQIPLNGYATVAVSANIYNRLAMPILVSQKLGSRWHIGLGLTPSWLISARSQFGGVELFRLSNKNFEASSQAFDAADGNSYSLESVNSLLNRNLPRFDLAATASAQFDLTKNWRIGLIFQRGLLNQTALPTVKKFHHSTNLQLIRWF